MIWDEKLDAAVDRTPLLQSSVEIIGISESADQNYTLWPSYISGDTSEWTPGL
jgi:hypothetical protein